MNQQVSPRKWRSAIQLTTLTLLMAGFGFSTGPAGAAPKITSSLVAGEEGEDWATLRCGKKVGGWQVYVEYDDARESIALKRNGVLTDLNFYNFNSGFSTLGQTLEFRVRSGKPVAAIVRHIHAIDPDDPNITRSALMVAKLSPKPCVVANIDPGPQQSALARATADKAASLPCLKPAG
jgi:hypothetical protein